MKFSEMANWIQDNYTAFIQMAEDTYIEAVALTKSPISALQPGTIFIIESNSHESCDLLPGNNYIFIGDDVISPDTRINMIRIPDNGITAGQIYHMVDDKLRKQARLNWELARLYHFFLTDDFLEPLMDYIYNLLGNQIMYVDYSHHILSVRRNRESNVDAWDSAIAEGRHPENYIRQNFHTNVKQFLSSKNYYFQEANGIAHYTWPVNDGGTLFGYFAVLATDRALSEEDFTIMEMIVNLTAIKFSNNMLVSSKGDYREIFMDLISGGIKDELDLNYRLLTRSWDRAEIYQVFLIDMQNKSERAIQYVNSNIDSLIHSVKHIIYERKVIVLFENMNMLSDSIQTLSQYCIKSNLKGGISEPFKDLFKLKDYFKQAEKAISFGESLDQMNLVHYYRTYQYIDWLSECCRKIECQKYYHSIVEKLELYDAKNSTDYYTTLLIYLENGKSINKTCSYMHLHKNTVNYRIQRVKELFHIDYDDGPATQHMYLSLKIHSLEHEDAKIK